MPSVTVGPAEVHYEISGAGPGLVLVHGTGGSAASNWGHLIDSFAERHTVVAPDVAGSGDTTDPGLRLQIEDLVDQVLGAATDAGQDCFDLVGFSLGALIAAAAAVAAPERVRSLVLIAGWASSDDARVQLQFRLWQELHARDHRVLAAFLTLTGFSPAFLSSMSWPELEGMVAEAGFTMPPGMPRQAELDLRVDITDVLPRIAAPTLVIGCTQDQMVPAGHSRSLHSAIAGSSYREFDTGHLVMYEQPDALVGAIEDFLDRRLSTRPVDDDAVEVVR